MRSLWAIVAIAPNFLSSCRLWTESFVIPNALRRPSFRASASADGGLRMKLDLVTYVRTEWISAALCTNQTPRSAETCLQLGTEDGRAINFIPRTILRFVTSSAERDGALTVSCRRQLKQQAERRQTAKIIYHDQPADDLREVENDSIDVVISLQAAARMVANGLDWKKSIREAARVLKPGGRLLFVEQTELQGESYLEYVQNLYAVPKGPSSGGDVSVPAPPDAGKETKEKFYPVFEEVGWDEVDLVLVPHTAGVAIKSEDAGLTEEQRAQKVRDAEQDRMAELSIATFERGIKKRRKKKKKKGAAPTAGEDDDKKKQS